MGMGLTDFDDFNVPSASVSFRTKQRQQNANPSEQAMYVPDAKPSAGFLAAAVEGAQQRETSIHETKKQPSKSPTANISIHLWLGSYYTTDMDGIPCSTYTHVRPAKKFTGKLQFILSTTFASHTDMMHSIVAKFTSEKHFLQREWKAMPINAKNPTDMSEFLGAAYEARTLQDFLHYAGTVPEKDVYLLSLISQTETEPPTSSTQVSKKLRVKQQLFGKTSIEEEEEPTAVSTRTRSGSERNLKGKAKGAQEQTKKRATSRKRAISQVDKSDEECPKKEQDQQGCIKVKIQKEACTKVKEDVEE